MSERQFDVPEELVYYQNIKDPDDVDLVVCDGEKYYRQMDPERKPIDFDRTQFRETSRLRKHNTEFGNYPWDDWQEWALEDGVEEDLAALGRSLIREADQHNWPRKLQVECGWADSGKAMIELALTKPEEAQKRWQHLLDTDGGGWYHDQQSGETRPMTDYN
jgi:hypothetical protein